MAQSEMRSEQEPPSQRGKVSPSNFISAELAAMGRKRINDFLNAQGEFIDKIQETSRQWFDRGQSEANLASEFASKLSATRSIPDALMVCQEWTTRRVDLMAEDGRRLLADTQKIMEAGARLVSNGWLRGNSDVST